MDYPNLNIGKSEEEIKKQIISIRKWFGIGKDDKDSWLKVRLVKLKPGEQEMFNGYVSTESCNIYGYVTLSELENEVKRNTIMKFLNSFRK